MGACPKCKAALPEPGPRFCPDCGTALRANDATVMFQAPGQADASETQIFSAPQDPAERKPEETQFFDASALPGPDEAPPSGSETVIAPGGLPDRGLGETQLLEPPGGGKRPGAPWDRRAELGFGTALIDTTKGVLFEPGRFFREMALDGGIGGPLLYGVMLGYLGLVVSTFYDFVMQTLMGGQNVVNQLLAQLGLPPQDDLLVVSTIVTLVIGAPLVAMGTFFVAAVCHLMLLILGGDRKGFEATFRVAAFTGAVSLFQLLPVCGSFLSLVFGLVVVVIGLSEAHDIGRGRAAAAVALPLLVLCCASGGLVLLLLSLAGNQFP